MNAEIVGIFLLGAFLGWFLVYFGICVGKRLPYKKAESAEQDPADWWKNGESKD